MCSIPPPPRKRAKKNQPVDADHESDDDSMQDDDDGSDEDMGGGGGGGGKGGGGKGKGRGKKSKPKEKRRRRKGFGPPVRYGTGKVGVETTEDDVHATTREEAARQRDTVVVKSVVWRQSLLPAHLVGLSLGAPPHANAATTAAGAKKSAGLGNGSVEAGAAAVGCNATASDATSVALVALISAKIVTVWALWRRTAQGGGGGGGVVGGGGGVGRGGQLAGEWVPLMVAP